MAILSSQIDPGVMDSLAEQGVAAVHRDLGRVDKLIGNIPTDYEHNKTIELKLYSEVTP